MRILNPASILYHESIFSTPNMRSNTNGRLGINNYMFSGYGFDVNMFLLEFLIGTDVACGRPHPMSKESLRNTSQPGKREMLQSILLAEGRCRSSPPPSQQSLRCCRMDDRVWLWVGRQKYTLPQLYHFRRRMNGRRCRGTRLNGARIATEAIGAAMTHGSDHRRAATSALGSLVGGSILRLPHLPRGPVTTGNLQFQEWHQPCRRLCETRSVTAHLCRNLL